MGAYTEAPIQVAASECLCCSPLTVFRPGMLIDCTAASRLPSAMKRVGHELCSPALCVYLLWLLVQPRFRFDFFDMLGGPQLGL